jgi:hypothetical protein
MRYGKDRYTDVSSRDEVEKGAISILTSLGGEGGLIVLAFVRFHNTLMTFRDCIPRKAGLVKINCTQMESDRNGMDCDWLSYALLRTNDLMLICNLSVWRSGRESSYPRSAGHLAPHYMIVPWPKAWRPSSEANPGPS